MEFNFYSVTNDLVRTVVRDHTEIGSVFDFDWDGRDNSGVVVSDGRYRMAVQNYEFFFEVDATAPVVQFALQDAYQSGPNGNVLVNPLLTWSVVEPLYSDAIIERSSIEIASGWTEFFEPDPGFTGTGQPGVKLLTLAEVDSAVFRHQVEDEAGNRTVTHVGPIAEQLIVSEFGPHKILTVDARDLFVPQGLAPYAPLTSIDGVGKVIGAGDAQVRFLVAETIRDSLAELNIQYRVLADSKWIVDEFNGLFDVQSIPNEIVNVGDLTNRFHVVWRPTNVESGEVYAVRLQAIDVNGDEIFSNVVRAKIFFKSIF